jgi:SAM domain (Sterile alpha motif)
MTKFRAAAWLEGPGLAQYAEIFAQQAVDFEVISDLTEVVLETLDIPLGHRKRIFKAIGALTGPARAADTDQAHIAPSGPSAERDGSSPCYFAIS